MQSLFRGFSTVVTFLVIASACSSDPPGRTETVADPSRTPARTSGQSSEPPSAWSRLGPGDLEVEHYRSLDAMVQNANVVVVGTATSARFSPVIRPQQGSESWRMLQVTVHAGRVLAGKIADGSEEVVIEFGPYFGHKRRPASIWRPLLGTHALIVLRQKGAPINLDPLNPNELARNVYRIVCSQGFFQDVDGLTVLPMTEGQLRFLKPFDGRPFAETLDAVTAISR